MIPCSYTTGPFCSWAWTRCSEPHGGLPGGRGTLSWDVKVVELDLEADHKMEEEGFGSMGRVNSYLDVHSK